MSKEIEYMARMAVRVLLVVDESGEVTDIELANVQSTITVDDFYSSLDEHGFEQLSRDIHASLND